MKKIHFIITLCLGSLLVNAQNTGVEKSIATIETGFLGAWVNNQYRLSNEISLKTEFGMVAGFRGCSDCDTQYILAPEFTIEPRWHYNIEKRSTHGKIIKNNSANFATASLRYYPDWFVFSNATNANVQNQITIIPKWGIRRSISNSNFNYELGIGIGKRYYFDSSQWDTTADFMIRIGYTFTRK